MRLEFEKRKSLQGADFFSLLLFPCLASWYCFFSISPIEFFFGVCVCVYVLFCEKYGKYIIPKEDRVGINSVSSLLRTLFPANSGDEAMPDQLADMPHVDPPNVLEAIFQRLQMGLFFT